MSGVNVFPAEAEQVVALVDGVKTCCVKGVPHQTKGVVLKAFVVANEGVDKDTLLEPSCSQAPVPPPSVDLCTSL